MTVRKKIPLKKYRFNSKFCLTFLGVLFSSSGCGSRTGHQGWSSLRHDEGLVQLPQTLSRRHEEGLRHGAPSKSGLE
jgi:hypothetical protein